MTRVALLGLGAMGRGMAARLIDAGHDVCVYNRTPEKMVALAEKGARVATRPAAAVDGAEVVIAIVADDGASRDIWTGSEGVLAGSPAPDAVMIESSTLSQTWVLELAGAVAEAGYAFLDCPVTGGPDGAEAGSLTLLLGGDDAVIERAWPTLQAYATRKIRFGDIGAGTAYKVMVNLMGAVQGAALAEGLVIAEKAGLDLKVVADALSSGAVASPHVKYLTSRMAAGDHGDVYFSLGLRWKDADYGLRLADDVGASTEISKAARALYEESLGDFTGDENESVIVETVRGGRPLRR